MAHVSGHIPVRESSLAADLADRNVAARPAGHPETIMNAARSHTKYSTPILSYPINVEEAPQGHYISFYIRVQDKAKLEAYKKAGVTIRSAEAFLNGANPHEARALVGEGHREYVAALALIAAAKARELKSSSIQLAKGTTFRLNGAISLYMPPNVKVSYESKYGDHTIGVLAETGYQALKNYQENKSTTESVADAFSGIELGMKQAILAAAEVAAPGVATLYALERGKIITPKMELMFEGIGRRNFSYEFTFIPKSKKEARIIQDIVYLFKYHMAANYAADGVGGMREMEIPSMFDIEYMHINKGNPNLNKISTCALTKMDVDYGGDRYVAYADGVPQTTKMSLAFTEMEIITKDHIKAGF